MDNVFPTGVGVNRRTRRYHGRNHVFPTGVGVNRASNVQWTRLCGIPHRRGGEPQAARRATGKAQVFPTGVGVNR